MAARRYHVRHLPIIRRSSQANSSLSGSPACFGRRGNGTSLAASFTKDENPDRTLLWEHYDNRAILRGKWKLVGLTGKPWELHDIGADRTEMHDLSKQHPETARELADLWEKEAHRTLIYPRP